VLFRSTIPIERLVESAEDWLAAPFDINAVGFGEAGENIAGYPHLVGRALGAFAEDLEFPLAFRDLGIDAFEIDAGIKTNIDVLFDDFTRHRSDVFVADAGVIRALWRGETANGESERSTVFVEEIFLFKTEPRIRIIRNGCARIGRARHTGVLVCFAHHQDAVFSRAVWIDGHGLEHDIGALALCL